MDDTLPLSIGGGIGQSRLCMFYLRKAHIGEIQASIWPEDMRKECEEHLIYTLYNCYERTNRRKLENTLTAGI